MCKTCKGTGGINVKTTWGIHFASCPDSNCDFDREKAWQETQATIDRIRREMMQHVSIEG